MTQEEKNYNHIGESLPNVIFSQMFGKPCLKVNGKAFSCFFENNMVFKLPKEMVDDVLKLKGAKLFDPSKKNRPMKEWVQIPETHFEKWEVLAKSAYHYLIKK